MFYTLTSLTAAIFHLLLTLFVFSRDWRAQLNRVYVLYGVALVTWGFSCYFKYYAYLDGNVELGMWLVRLVHISVVILPITGFHLGLLLARIEKPRLLKFLYFIHALFALSVFTPYYIRGLKPTPFGYYAIGGPVFFLFMSFYFIMGISIFSLIYHKQRSLSPLYRTRLRSFSLALLILYMAGVHDLLPLLGMNLGVRNYPFTPIPIQPLGSLAAIFYGVILAYSVLQYQLLDIHLSLSRWAAQLVRMLFMNITGFLLLLLIMFTPLFPSQPNNTIIFVNFLLILIVTSLLTSALFPRFFGKGEERLERRILGDVFEYHDRIRTFIGNMGTYSSMEILFRDFHDLVVNSMRIPRYHVFLNDELQHTFKLFQGHPSQVIEALEIKYDSPLIQLFRDHKVDYLVSKLSCASIGDKKIEEDARQQLSVLEAEFCFPLMAGDDPFGLLLIGKKGSHDPYTSQDILLLIELVKSLSPVLNQIRLMNQLMLAEEMELLGKMSRGIAHDMNNLLTPVFTYLQLASAGVQGPEMTQELLPTALRNVEAMRAYVRESLFFSKTQSLQLKEFCLDKVVRSSIELYRDRAKKKNITALVHAPNDIRVEMDEVLIQRLVGNLLSNAIDASPEGAQIHVHLLPMGQTETLRNWFRILVVDHGEGISSDNLKRVTKGYFTTKDHGDTTRGFGLGLAICRKIIHMHGGQLTIHSQQGKGTTVQVDLPSRIIMPQPVALPAFT